VKHDAMRRITMERAMQFENLSSCRAYDHENPCIAGRATMPSSSRINATLWRVADSLRMADRFTWAMKS